MYTIKTPYLLHLISKKFASWRIKTNDKVLYFTFDDGPIPEVTPQVLKILEKYNAKATFFMVGENVYKYPEIYKQVVKAGHIVGNHTFNHLKGMKSSNFEYYKNVLKASQYIESKLFRPPHGQIKIRQINVLSKHYNIVMWSVLSADFDSKISPEKCKNNIIKNAKEGSIIVLHDSIKAKKNMLYALEESLNHFSKLGFHFEALNHLNH